MSWIRIRRKKNISLVIDEISPLASLGFPSMIGNEQLSPTVSNSSQGWGNPDSNVKIHRGPRISPYFVSQMAYKLNYSQVKCFVCMELLGTRLVNECVIPLICGSLVHEQCLVQIVECNSENYNNGSFPKCYCSSTCDQKIVPKNSSVLDSILLSLSITEKTNPNFSTLSKTLLPPIPPKPGKCSTQLIVSPKNLTKQIHLAQKRPSVLFDEKSIKENSPVVTFNTIEYTQKLLTSPEPQIDDLWINQLKSSRLVDPLKLPYFGNDYLKSASLPTLTERTESPTLHPTNSNIDYDKWEPLPNPENHNDNSLRKNRLPSIVSTESRETDSFVDRNNSVSKSVFSSRLSTSTIDTITAKIESYKNIPLDTLKNRFIKYLLDNCSKFSYTQLIQSGSLRLVDSLLISYDNCKWHERIVYLFENCLAIWNEKCPVLINIYDVSIALPSPSILQLKFTKDVQEISLRCHVFSVIEKWVVAISDRSFDFPAEIMSSTIELDVLENAQTICKFNSNASIVLTNSTKESTIDKPGKRVKSFSMEQRESFPSLSINSNKVDSHLRSKTFDSNYDSQLAVSDDTEAPSDTDVDSDQELIDQLVLQHTKSHDKWQDLIKNIDDCIPKQKL